jgi:AAHS family 4-hydroxybenzoate transporter-like MFS transporter
MGRTVDIASIIETDRLSKLQLAIVAMLAALMVTEGFDMQAISFAAPQIIKDWSVSRAAMGPTLSASLMGYLVGALTLAAAGDKFGRKKIIVAGTLIFAFLTLACAFAPSLSALLVLRFLAGLGLGGAIPTGVAFVSEYVPTRLRATTVGILYAVYALGGGLGGFLAAWTIPKFGWPSVFLIGGGLPLAIALLLVLRLPESVRFLVLNGRDPDRVLEILCALRPERSFDSSARFVVTEEKRERSSIAALFSEKRAGMTSLLWLAFIMSFLGHHFLSAWLPVLLSDSGLSIAAALSGGALYQIGGTVGSLAFGRPIDKWGKIVIAGVYLAAIPFVAPLGLISLFGYVVASAFLAGVFVVGGQVGIIAMAGSLYPTSMRSTGTGCAMGIGRLGSITGPIIGGLMLEAGYSQATLFELAAIPLFCCALAVLALLVHTRKGEMALQATTSPAE